MDIRFVANEPALCIDRTLVVSDVHLGIEYQYHLSGIKVLSQTAKIQARILSLLKSTGSDAIIFLGDTKHKVPGTSFQEEREVPIFFEELSQKAKISCVMGNHDPGLEKLVPKEIQIKPTKGFLLGKFYFSHGHTWPSNEVRKAEYIVIGHLQPQIEFRDALGYTWREPVWVRTKMSRKKVEAKYGKIKSGQKLIILPAFNELAGGYALNKKEKDDKEHRSPIIGMAEMKKSRIYMLDGTYLGELSKL